MKRSELLDKSRSCQILLVSTDTFLSKGIRWFEECKWSHAAFVIRVNGESFVVEANKEGIVTTELSHYVNDKKYLLGLLRPNFVITIDKEMACIKHALLKCGKHHYSFRHLLKFQVVRYAWKKLFGKELWIDDSAIISPKWRFICGQFCAYMINWGFPGTFNNWKEFSPKDLYDSAYFTFEEITD